ncbi:DUF4011 domain-containing protein [Actinomyces israelii]|uniref:DUF4011 domain-containing protein n=1 Tax=Actinomyces israelii TaxID=1659 RepID=A0ABT4IA13_9ACTO|nr:DUF4011 domain-containing protein [Actinomyces israelii]MCZ0858587.1 DUF4011 domain-containing protein [Actinomyces israelii]
MKLSNRDLVLRGLLGVLPTHLERYLRSTLGSRCTPERLRLLLADSGDLSDLPDLADLSIQIRILTARGADGRYRVTLPPGLGSKLHEVRRFRNEVVHGGAFDTDRTLAALVAVSETLRLIGAEPGRAEVRELIAAIDSGRGAGRTPLDAVGVEVACEPVVSYAHAVAGVAPEVSVRLSLPGRGAGPDLPASVDGQQRLSLVSGSRGGQEPPSGVLEVTITIIEDDGGREVAEPWHLAWDTSHPVLTGTRALALDRENLLQVDQPGAAHVRVELRAADGTQSVRRLPGLTVLPPRQWRLAGAEGWAGAALATFVQPDQAAVKALTDEALGTAKHDGDATGPDALAAAACTALRRRRIDREDAGPWRSAPSLVRTAAGLLDSRTGTVLDVAVLLAGVLDRLGTAPVLLLTPETILVGYRRRGRDGRAPASPQEAADLIRRGVMGMIDPDLAVGAAVAVLHELPGRARGVALEALSDLTLAVPVGAARPGGAAPQPLLERDDDGVVAPACPEPPDNEPALDDDGPAAEPSAALEAGQPPADDASATGSSAEAPDAAGPSGSPEPAPPAVEEWKRSLLDLSRRNPLISLSARDTVKLWVPPDLIGRLEDIVNAGDLVALRPDPYGAPNRASASADERAALLTEEQTVYVNLSGKECGRRLQTMAASARTALAETGANNLYLTIGSLTWRIDGVQVRSPLILIPVNLAQEDGPYVISLDEAGASTPNHSLLARFKASTGIDLVELREPVHDEHGIDVKATLERVRRRLRRAGRRDTVERTVHLGLFGYSTYRMWQDLEKDWRTIVSNPLVGHLLETPSGAPAAFPDPAGGADGEPAEDVDEVVESLPLVADSDQARVVADAAAGRSLVVEGPPGTGKSQTVANLIFRALARGRTVMFVAEKASALDVVARRLREEAGIGGLLLNLHDNGMRPAAVYEALRCALDLRAPGPDAAAEADELRERLGRLRERLGEYREGLHDPRDGFSYYRVCQELIEARDAETDDNGTAQTRDAESDQGEVERARSAFEARARETGLDAFDPAVHARLLADYRRTQERLRKALTPELLGSVLARRDRILREAGPRAEELRREVRRRRGTMNVRELISSYWDLVVAITPCILVSPDSVARFFPSDRRYVDVVVFDEASQITVAGAVGAMGRGQSVVVVGDPKQMPPATAPGTTRGGGDLEGAGRRENGSILDRCLAGGVPSRRLTWHYRSRVESLIAFSNRHYYDGRLLTFPSPLTLAARPSDDGPGGYGVSLRRVEGGAYQGERARAGRPGVRSSTNPVEAHRVVEEVVRRFEAHMGVPSVGVITFNARQRDLIETLLRKKIGSQGVDEALRARDGLFVRNLENAQGEERDAILFSLTFSANERGDVPLGFGSLGHAGGERRLNVAITRARCQIVLFSSFDPEDLHAERSAHQGLRDLRAYLEQARSGDAPRALPASRSAVDLHRNEIAERLREAGLAVSVGVGHSSFEIDLVLAAPGAGQPGRGAQPGRPRVAVLLDGPGWDRRGSVMDRDLLPVDVLKSMEWERIERVWTPEWVADPDAVVARLVEAAGGTLSTRKDQSQQPQAPEADGDGQAPPDSDAVADVGAAAAPAPAREGLTAAPRGGLAAASAAPGDGPAAAPGAPGAPDGTAVLAAPSAAVPSASTAPGALAAPSASSAPAAPAEPAASTSPAEPTAPAEPAAPTSPAGPSTPDTAVPDSSAAAPAAPTDYREWRPEGTHPRDVLDRAEKDPEAKAQVIEVARAICDVESPLTRHRLVVKVCRTFGLSRTAKSREERVRRVLGETFAYIDADDFVWRTYDASLLPVSYRRGALDHVDAIEEIHPRELVALMADVRARAHEWDSADELYQRALRRLSAKRRRLGARGILPALETALKEAEQEGAE